MSKEALYYKQEDEYIRCFLCPHNCLISEGRTGICNVRKVEREEGELKLFTLNYGEVTSIALDPVIKKPLYHFYKDSMIISIGSFGCNLKCSFCQNYTISQFRARSKYIAPEEVLGFVQKEKKSIGIAFTYNEPTIWYEYILDVAKMIKEYEPDKKTVLVTNGFITEDPLRELLPFIDALNIDLKGNDDYYKKVCFGSLESVEETIRIANSFGKHIEITTLLVTGENTDRETIEHIGDFIANVNKDIPIHISRYFPKYKMDSKPTTLEEMKEAYKILKSKLTYVHLGNLSEEEKFFVMSN